MVEEVFHVAAFVDEPTAFVASAVAFGDPAATEAASVAKSASKAALTAMVSPAEACCGEVSVSLVWLAMFDMPVNSVFHCEAVIVSPAPTVGISACPRPYAPDPVPAKWLYPNGELELFTNVLY
jgi:hypothetical protein